MTVVVGIDVGLHNLALCRILRNGDDFTIEQWKLIDCAEGLNAKKLSIEQSVALVVQTLKLQGDLFSGAEVVAIESQPVGRVATGNTKMKCVSHAIQAFVLSAHPSIGRVLFVNPKNKMANAFVGKTLQLEGGDDAVKKRYKKHKDAAVAAVTELVRGVLVWEEFFHSLKKRDDVADSLLLACVAKLPAAKKRKRRMAD